jgi:hypothetical protein
MVGSSANFFKIGTGGRAWWYTAVIPALGRLRQEDHEFKASLGHMSQIKKKKRKEGTKTTQVPRVREQQPRYWEDTMCLPYP